MKSALLFALLFCAWSSFAQTNPNLKQFGNQILDVSPSKIYNFGSIEVLPIKPFEILHGKIDWVQDGIVGFAAEKSTRDTVIESKIVPTDWEYDRLVALTNFPEIGKASVGQSQVLIVVKIGLFHGYEDQPVDLYDCGKPYTPPALTPAQIKAEQQAARIHALVAKKNSVAAQIKAVQWLQSQATNGDASAQCDLGEHYLAGIGCETNLTQGIFWLTQAANQGNNEASNKLAHLH